MDSLLSTSQELSNGLISKRIYVTDGDSIHIFYPYEGDKGLWKKINDEGKEVDCQGEISLLIKGNKRILDIKEGIWYDEKYMTLPTVDQQEAYDQLSSFILDSNDKISESNNRRETISTLMKKIIPKIRTGQEKYKKYR